ncbi:MAG: DNA repair protein RecO [Bacteroidia bacterium]
MLVKTEGIVLSRFDYSDTSIIVKIYTRHYGLQTFMIRGAHGKKSTQKASLFQPLSLLEIVFYHKENQEIKTPKEIRLAHAYQSLQSHFLKSSIAVFLAEILGKAIRETFPDERKYEFIKNSLLHFDLQDEGTVNFHLLFLLKLSNYLGFSITDKEIAKLCPNIASNNSSAFSGKNSSCGIKTLNNEPLLALLKHGYLALPEIQINNIQRREILNSIINYYREHIENFGEVKSLEVFQQIFD